MKANANDMFISVITLYELEIGVLLIERRDPHQGVIFRHWLNDIVIPTFQHRLLPLDPTIAIRAAGLHDPDPKPLNDAYVAATALVHGMTVVTRNVADFQNMDVALLNPWEAL
jgi:predicted nucleic acid-binding protein